MDEKIIDLGAEEQIANYEKQDDKLYVESYVQHTHIQGIPIQNLFYGWIKL